MFSFSHSKILDSVLRNLGAAALVLCGLANLLVGGEGKKFPDDQIHTPFLSTLSPMPRVFDRPVYFHDLSIGLEYRDGSRRFLTKPDITYGLRGPWNRGVSALHAMTSVKRNNSEVALRFVHYFFCQGNFFREGALHPLKSVTIRVRYLRRPKMNSEDAFLCLAK